MVVYSSIPLPGNRTEYWKNSRHVAKLKGVHVLKNQTGDSDSGRFLTWLEFVGRLLFVLRAFRRKTEEIIVAVYGAIPNS